METVGYDGVMTRFRFLCKGKGACVSMRCVGKRAQGGVGDTRRWRDTQAREEVHGGAKPA